MTKEPRWIVKTPYGKGVVLQKRKEDGMYETQLDGFIGKLYTAEKYPSVTPEINNDVICTFGRGIVESIEGEQCTVRLSSWRLAQRCTVRCYLRLDTVSVVGKKSLREMNTFERVSYGQTLKTKASEQFRQKKYNEALKLYADAIDSVRFVQHDAQSDNYIRADLVLLMVTCSNNAGTCCVQLEKLDQAHRFATNALVLVDALYAKRGKKIHSILMEDGFTDAKLFGEFTTKSRLLLATALHAHDKHDEAIATLKVATTVVTKYLEEKETAEASIKGLKIQEKQIKKLHAQCLHRKRLDKKKEIKRAQAMFGSKSSAASTPDVSSSSSSPKNDSTASTTTVTASTPSTAPASVKPTSKPASPPASAPPKSLRRSINGSMKKSVTFAPDHDLNQISTIPDDEKKCDSDDHVKMPSNNVLNSNDDDSDEEEEMPWYQEHKEALIVAGLAGVMGLSTMLLRKR
uniref:Peptidylprolyl isomerase n=1 Tax=Ditylum brightwellii TaxID=49249 RepID=A0A7S4VCI4_9STRA